jgi:uncharacterized protein YjbI with pentapeptide repeats
MAEDPFVRPMNYSPPTSAVELLERYASGHRFFVGASLRNAQLLNADLQDVNLTEADLFRADLSGANLRNAVLDRAFLRESSLFNTCLASAQIGAADLYDCRLCNADLTKSVLRESNFWCADLDSANLSGADLSGASLRFADLTHARLERAVLTNANLVGAQLVNTVLDAADISGSRVYGVSAWSVSLKDTKQQGLIITDDNEPTVTVDDLEVAQFIHLLLRNQNLRKVIETVTSKMILILGRFTDERKAVLRLIKTRLDGAGYLAVIFDFDKPASRNLTETVRTLAHLSKFIIADLTDARSIPQELMAVVPFLPSVAIKPIIFEGDETWAMFGDFERYTWVLPVWRYSDLASVERGVMNEIIRPLEEWHDRESR